MGVMAYQAREAPAAEWPRIGALAGWAAVPDPTMARVVVVEEAGQIVGAWCLLTAIHLEGAWIAPSHRCRVGVVRRLVAGVFEILRVCEARVVYTAAVDPDVGRLARKLGFERFPGEWFVKALAGT